MGASIGAFGIDVTGHGDRDHVEAAEVRPLTLKVETAQLVRDDSRAAGGETPRRYASLIEVEIGAGEDVGSLQQIEEAAGVGLVIEVAIRGPLADVRFQAPVHMVGIVRLGEMQHVGAELGQGAAGHRSADDVRAVKHANSLQRHVATLRQRDGIAVADLFYLDDRLGGEPTADGMCQPLFG